MSSRAFTLIELLVVIAIISILSMVTLGGFSSIANQYALSGAHGQVLSALEEARARALASINDFSANAITLFPGTTYSATDPNNRVTTLSGRATISGITLAGGGSTVVFSKATGATVHSGTIVVSQVSDASRSRSVSIATSGRIE
jgi:prepilin-type N-terminal cleavage/methylation domain-containing protein